MARPIVLSNGQLHVGINRFGNVHDFYYPYVGFENHSAGSTGALRHRIGVWVDGQISWTDNPDNSEGVNTDWVYDFKYPHSALIGHIKARNDKLGVLLEFDDFVDAEVNAFFRNIHIVNLRDASREIRLFMHQAFIIGDSRSNTDTAQYIPDSKAILHYRGRRAFVVSGNNGETSFDDYSVGLFGIEGKEGTYMDAEDGELDRNNVEHGRVDSTIRFTVNIDAHSSKRVHYWIAAGNSIHSALGVHRKIQKDHALTNLKRTADWWNNWLKPLYDIIDKVPDGHRESFLKSVMIIKSQIDKSGAVIASTDTSMLNYSRDAYAYCWPRDGAFAIWPLIRMGYKDEPVNFFRFVRSVLHPNGYMMHKYRADGALGSSWHSYVHEGGIIAPPIQEDETALPLLMFAEYFKKHNDRALLDDYYETMVKPMAEFLANYIDEETGLPKPSYDLWEQFFLTTTFTTATVYAALVAASELATAYNDQDNAIKWQLVADDIQAAAHKWLYNQDKKMFYRGLLNSGEGNIRKDDSIDNSSVFGAYVFGLFKPDSSEIKSSIATIMQLFGINDGKVGLPRYENDDYRRTDKSITGNIWFIVSFWLAQYYIDEGNNDKALEILNNSIECSLSTGMMGEQMDPVSHKMISPSPLTWSHAEYITTILNLISKTKN